MCKKKSKSPAKKRVLRVKSADAPPELLGKYADQEDETPEDRDLISRSHRHITRYGFPKSRWVCGRWVHIYPKGAPSLPPREPEKAKKKPKKQDEQ